MTKKRKIALRATTISHGQKTRTSVQVGLITVDVGPHSVVIQRPRHQTEDEDKTWPEHDALLDVITVTFDRDDPTAPYKVKASCCGLGKGCVR